MSKIQFEVRKSLLRMIEMKPNGKFTVFNNGKKDKNYYKELYVEIENMMQDYQDQLISGFENNFTMVMKESNITYSSVENIEKVFADIWISYLDCYNIIISCEIKNSVHVLAKCTKTFILIEQLNNKRVRVPKQIINDFISDLNKDNEKQAKI